MASGPDRRMFLRGAAGAVGMGAVGALATRLELGAASGSADKNQAVQQIQVLLVPNGGKKKGVTLFVPPASAAEKDKVRWVATTPNIERIHKIAFDKPPPPDPVPNPFSDTVAEFTNTPGTEDLELTVLDEVKKTTYHYTIWVKQKNGGMHQLDPDLDIT